MKRYGLLFALILAGVLRCQGPDDLVGLPDLGACVRGAFANGGVPRTNEQFLACFGVQSTKEALLNALADPRPVVRSVAAQTLAENRQNDAPPAIEAALSTEMAPGTRMTMSYALALLGEKQGITDLRRMCNSASASITFRMAAADYLDRLHDEEDWADGLIAVLQSAKRSSSLSDEHRNSTLRVGLIDIEHGLPADKASSRQLDEIRELAGGGLSGDSRDLRIAASQALGKFGDVASARAIQAAIAREKDQGVRERMESDLAKLTAAQR